MQLIYIPLRKVVLNTFFILVFTSLCFCTHARRARSYPEGAHISIAAIGDVMCHGAQLEAAYDPDCACYRFDPAFHPVRKYLADAHITLANLETTLPGNRRFYAGYPLFGSPDSLIHALRRVGVDILTLANNHSLDNGRLGLVRTIQAARRLGFYHLGTYTSYRKWKKNRVLLISRNGIRLAFLNYTHSTNGIPIPSKMRVNLMHKKVIARDLRAAHQLAADAIIVIYHFGKEYSRWPTLRQKSYVSHAFRHGADVVLGAHPHVLQPYEIKLVRDIYGRQRKRLVAYSLGNFVSNQQWRYADGGMIFYFDLVKKRATNAGEHKILFRNIDYEPTWVYVEKKGKKRKYFVLPVKEYIENNRKPRLSKTAHRKMLQFFKDTTAHLANSYAQSKRLSKAP